MIPTFYPSHKPSKKPSSTPSVLPTSYPSSIPSSIPTSNPSTDPSSEPSVSPSILPSDRPSLKPSANPSTTPSIPPTSHPSPIPSSIPTSNPSIDPSSEPSVAPSISPSDYPSLRPSATPSTTPSIYPTVYPSYIPSSIPTLSPSIDPSSEPSVTPSIYPSDYPSLGPSATPSILSTIDPIEWYSETSNPTPSVTPSIYPSDDPSPIPTLIPTLYPSQSPSSVPSSNPNSDPSSEPSVAPSAHRSDHPSLIPTLIPTLYLSPSPSSVPSSKPSTETSSQPSTAPSVYHSDHPSLIQTALPSLFTSLDPSSESSIIPTINPNVLPTLIPSDIQSTEGTFFFIELGSGRRTSRWLLNSDSISDESLEALATETQLFLNDVTSRTIIGTFANIFPSPGASIVTVSFEVIALTEDSFSEPLHLTVTSSILENIDEFISVVQNSDPAFADVMSATLDATITFGPSVHPSVLSANPSSYPSKLSSNIPTTHPTAFPSRSPTVSHKPSTQPTRYPTVSPTDRPSLMPSSFPSQVPSLTPPVTEIYSVPYYRSSNISVSNLTIVEVSVEEDDSAMHEKFVHDYNATTCTISDCRRLTRRSGEAGDEIQPFIIESVHSRILEDNEDTEGNSYKIETNVSITRYPVQFSTDRSELIVRSTVLDYMDDREIQIRLLVPSPSPVNTIVSITFEGVNDDEMTEEEIEIFLVTMSEFLDDYLGMLQPPVLLTDLQFDSQLQHNTSTTALSDTASSERQLEESTEGDDATNSNMTTINNQLTVNVLVVGEYLPPPEIEFDEVVVEVLSNENTQEDFLVAIDESNNPYFEPVINNVGISSVETYEEERFEDDSESSKSSKDTLINIVVGSVSALLLLLFGTFLYRWNQRRSGAEVRYRLNKETYMLHMNMIEKEEEEEEHRIIQ